MILLSNLKYRLTFVLSVILAALLVAGILYFAFTDKNDKDKDKTDATSSQVSDINVEDISDDKSQNVNSEEISDDGTGLSPNENVSADYNNRTGEKAETPTPPKAPVKAEDAEKPLKEERKYVQDADPETGISWDGISAIIYRLTSGEETFTKTYGAYYELRPNVWVLLEEPTDREEWDGRCHHCGKISGDGNEGTCVRYMMGDIDCPICDEHIPVNTCHTCKEN
jgi:hypothetical protein